MRISDWSSDVCSSDLQRAHDHRLADKVGPADIEIHALDLLRVIGGEACEQQYADDADRQAERARLHEHVDHHRRSEEHTSALQSLMRISYAVFCLKKTTNQY